MAAPPLQEATLASTQSWLSDLQGLFNQSKERFPDVVWEVGEEKDEVWGHKAIVYSRAPPSFQSRYFQFRQHSETEQGAPLSLLSLDIPSSPLLSTSRSPSPAPGGVTRLSTPISTVLFANELEYLYTGQGFSEAFEFLFDSSLDTDQNQTDTEQIRIDKLRKDLVFMWRSRLYSDVKIALSAAFSSQNHETSTAIFSSHRFILASRCSYFYTALISWPSPSSPPQKRLLSDSPSPSPLPEPEPSTLTLTLPSPPFTPASLHFTLGFIYTGTLIFSHRSYDLATALALLQSATYLGLQTLYDEVQARIIQEMMHGLFHAFLEFSEYERLNGGLWGPPPATPAARRMTGSGGGGCHCRACTRRAPRILAFSLSLSPTGPSSNPTGYSADPSVPANPHLERGSRRALVSMFGQGWATPEFAALPANVIHSLVKGVSKRAMTRLGVNVLRMLDSAEAALIKLDKVSDGWGESARDSILTARKAIDRVFIQHTAEILDDIVFSELLTDSVGGAVGFEDGERLGRYMSSIERGLNDSSRGGGSVHAPKVYEALVSSVLLRLDPEDHSKTLLSPTSWVRVQVDQTRLSVVALIQKRWMNIRLDRGFEGVGTWAVQEIADFIQVPQEDILAPLPPSSSPPSVSTTSSAPTKSLTKSPATSSRTLRASDASTAASAADAVSLRAGVLSRNAKTRGTAITPTRERIASDASSAKSVARSIRSSRNANTPNQKVGDVNSDIQGTPTNHVNLQEAESVLGSMVKSETDPRPDSKLTPNLNTNPPNNASMVSLVPSARTVGTIDSVRTASPKRPIPPIPTSTPPIVQVQTDQDVDMIDGTAGPSDDRGLAAEEAYTTPAFPLAKTLVGSVILGPDGKRKVNAGASNHPSGSRAGSGRGLLSPTVNPGGSSIYSAFTSGKRARDSSIAPRPPSAASSVTRRRGTGLRPHVARPGSAVSNSTSTTTDNGTEVTQSQYKTATERTRRGSTASTRSTFSTLGATSASPRTPSRVSNIGRKSPTPSTRSVRSVRSVNSVRSTATAKGRAPSTTPSPAQQRRPPSVASVSSMRSTSAGKESIAAAARKQAKEQIVGARRASGVSGVSPAERKRKISGTTKVSTVPPVPKPSDALGLVITRSQSKQADVGIPDDEPTQTSSVITLKAKQRANALAEHHKKTDSQVSTSSTASGSTLRRKGSTETITTGTSTGLPTKREIKSAPSKTLPSDSLPISQKGAMLEIGIPCIISSKRKKFRAYARYIGEVEGELGPWVGVEVSGDSLPSDLMMENGTDDGRAWHDGTWGGIRYFEISSSAASSLQNSHSSSKDDWDYGGYGDEGRAARKRRVEWVTRMERGLGGMKRSGGDLSLGRGAKRIRSSSPAVSDASGVESRGLWVRPQQVLYVVDALDGEM